jgi:hypothetical protein
MKTNQKARECANKLPSQSDFQCSHDWHVACEKIIASHFADEPERLGDEQIIGDLCKQNGHRPECVCKACSRPQQPSKSLDEILEKYLPLQKYYEQTREQAKQACIEYAAQLQRKDDGWRYFRTYGVEKLPIDTEINCHGAWHLAATYPAYDAATNYQARTKGAI